MPLKTKPVCRIVVLITLEKKYKASVMLKISMVNSYGIKPCKEKETEFSCFNKNNNEAKVLLNCMSTFVECLSYHVGI